MTGRWVLSSLLASVIVLSHAQAPPNSDASPPKVRFVNVDKDVTLEVLDWGGSGRALILLSGEGDTAHVFDQLAPKLNSNRHVYAITRRGFGASSSPDPKDENYTADRLGDDVLAVMDTLRIDKPVIAGHSIAGEELSSIGSRHPERVSGLIYLDAGQPYAYYDPVRGGPNLIVDANELRKKLDLLMNQQTMIGGINDLANALPQFQKDVEGMQKQFVGISTSRARAMFIPTRAQQIAAAIARGERKYSDIKVPLLAIFAWPSVLPPVYPPQADLFQAIPGAKVVRLVGANHYVFRSNEAQVIHEMNVFMDGLN
jgi:non-heme chloroperoxidase